MKSNQKQKALDAIAKEISLCEMCKEEKTGLPVAGEGNPDADIVFLGEAPGKQEAATGRPFIGRSGQLLRRLIRESGLTEEEVFITSPVKYLPLRGTPTPKHIAHGKVHLDAQFSVIEPKIIVLLGNTACQAMFGEKVPIMQEHGTMRKLDGRTYYLTIHPAAAIRFKKNVSIITEDFKKLRKLLS